MDADYKELLCGKMRESYSDFINYLKGLPSEQIIERSYEKVMKEDIILACEYGNLTNEEAKALYRLKDPLEDLYSHWLKSDSNYMEMLQNTVEYRAKSALREFNSRQKESR